MDAGHVLSLSLVQGLTEFLPVSSSAHLILFPVLLGWSDQGLAFDVAVHVGTLAAVIGYFRGDLARLGGDWARSLRERRTIGDSRLAWGVLLGTVPVAAGGLLVEVLAGDALRAPVVIAVTTVLFGVLLWWADRSGRRARDEHSLDWRDVLLIGLAQALALIPGTSRAGVTITAGLALGLTRSGAARFSFLLSIPVIVLAGTVKALEALAGTITVSWSALLSGALIAAVSAWLTIHFFLKLVERIGLLPFVIYRLVLGAILFAFVV